MDKRIVLILIFIFFCSLSYAYAYSDENSTIENNEINIKDFHELNVYNDEYQVYYFKNDTIFENYSQQQDFSKNNSISKSYSNNETFEKVNGYFKLKTRDFNNGNKASLPVVWSNCSSDLYSSSFYVKLSAWDLNDENPLIYYTCDGFNPINCGLTYNGPIDFRHYFFKFNCNPKDKTTQKMFNKLLNEKYNEIPLYFTGSGDIPPAPEPKNWTNVGKYIRQLYDEFQGFETTSEKLIFLKSGINELLTLGLFIESSESINVIVYYLISWYFNHNEDG